MNNLQNYQAAPSVSHSRPRDSNPSIVPSRQSGIQGDGVAPVVSSNASGAIAHIDLFSNRDQGLACFNILDHLRQTSDKKENNQEIVEVDNQNAAAQLGIRAEDGIESEESKDQDDGE